MSGDDSIVEYPLFQTENGGAIPTSPLQLLLYEILPAKACALNRQWHSLLPLIDESNILRNTHQVCYAASYQNQYFAVAIWTSPVAQNRFTDGKQILELRRLAISNLAPKNTATRMLKIMRLKIRQKFPDILRLISYQDTDVHKGTIYQADNWTPVKSIAFMNWTTARRKRSESQSTSSKIRWEYIM